MPAWWKFVGVAVLMVLPGGFFLLAGYALARAFRDAWHLSTVAARSEGQPMSVRSVFSNLKFRDTFRQMRGSAG
jgi:hypothetical protein